jgi:hypothetical protein
MFEQNEVPCGNEGKIPQLTREQLEGFTKISLDFLRQHMTDEEISSIEIEIKFNPISKECPKEILTFERSLELNVVRIGCQPGPPIDTTCAPKRGYFGLPSS